MPITQRDLLSRVAKLSVKVVELTRAGSGHWQLLLENEYGKRKTFFYPSTPSDHRGLLNKDAQIKRFAKGLLT